MYGIFSTHAAATNGRNLDHLSNMLQPTCSLSTEAVCPLTFDVHAATASSTHPAATQHKVASSAAPPNQHQSASAAGRQCMLPTLTTLWGQYVNASARASTVYHDEW